MNADIFYKQHREEIEQFEIMVVMLGYEFYSTDREIDCLFKIEIRNEKDDFLKFIIKVQKNYCEVFEGLFSKTGFTNKYESYSVKFDTLNEALKEVMRYL